MSSRVERYIENENNYENNPSRTSKNAKLYREVYNKYENLDNLPIEDNTDEIDLERLKELVSNSNTSDERKQLRESLNILDTRKRKIDTQKIYDINQMLEKAKNDNNKLKEPNIRGTIINKKILSTLEMEDDYLSEVNQLKKAYEIKEIADEIDKKRENLSMTREYKFKELSEKVEKFNSNPLIEQVMPDNDLSLDLFEELKPTENTIVTKPIKEETTKNEKPDLYSKDTKDIDIIKPNNNNLEEFFTNSYEFSKKDFTLINDNDDFFEQKKENNILKIILLLLAIVIFASAIIYFIKNYGLGI